MIRKYRPEDYELISEWWSYHKAVSPPKIILPETGLIKDDICASFMYTVENKIGFIAWTVSNPTSRHKDIYDGVKDITKMFIEKARADSIMIIFTTTDVIGLSRLYESCGFTNCSKQSSELIFKV